MIYSGCQSQSKEIKIFDKVCPKCGSPIEMFSIDTEMKCEKCGYVVYNDTLSCTQWCKYARKCVGDEMYEKFMAILASQKQRKDEET